jgi:hypothetical protein
MRNLFIICIINSYYIFHKGLFEECYKEENLEVTGLLLELVTGLLLELVTGLLLELVTGLLLELVTAVIGTSNWDVTGTSNGCYWN